MDKDKKAEINKTLESMQAQKEHGEIRIIIQDGKIIRWEKITKYK